MIQSQSPERETTSDQRSARFRALQSRLSTQYQNGPRNLHSRRLKRTNSKMTTKTFNSNRTSWTNVSHGVKDSIREKMIEATLVIESDVQELVPSVIIITIITTSFFTSVKSQNRVQRIRQLSIFILGNTNSRWRRRRLFIAKQTLIFICSTKFAIKSRTGS